MKIKRILKVILAYLVMVILTLILVYFVDDGRTPTNELIKAMAQVTFGLPLVFFLLEGLIKLFDWCFYD